jgi:hypothetical protein
VTLRAIALLALAAFGVHQARYAIVPDAHGDAGHGYLAAAPVVLGLLLAVALGAALRAALAAERSARSPGVRWAACGAALLALHTGQEAAEWLLAGGGPGSAAALISVPLCLLAGALVAVMLRRADDLLDVAGRAVGRAVRVPPFPPAAKRAARPCAAPRRAVLAYHAAGRAPPALG